MPHDLVIEGGLACFQRGEMSCDVVTYDVITPMAARRIFEAIHWTPSIWWRIDRIEVLRPIRTMWRDEEAASGSRNAHRAQCLIDVAYRVTGRFDMTPAADPGESAAQHAEMFRRRARSRRFFRQPTLGRRDLPAEVRLAEQGEEAPSVLKGSGTIDLGWMLYDRDPDARDRLRYYRPSLVDGVIDVAATDPASLPY